MTTEQDRPKNEATAQLESIMEMVQALKDAGESDNEDARESAYEAIQEDPLSVEVRSDWHSVGNKEDSGPSEYRILLSWGGPACRIIGELNEHAEPETATIEYQDWGIPWTALTDLTEEQENALLIYARQFYYSEEV